MDAHSPNIAPGISEQPNFAPVIAPAANPGFVPAGKITAKEVSSSRAILKLGIFLAIVLVFGSVSTVLVTKNFTQSARNLARGVIFSQSLTDTVWQSYGSVPEAELVLPISGPGGSEIEQDFLLDTGAVVSSLPREMAETLGYNLAFLPRQTFKGFGNTTSFAYEAEMDVQLGSQTIKLPVVFTEASGSRALLGRKGMFDKFTIVVDHKNKMVEIRE